MSKSTVHICLACFYVNILKVHTNSHMILYMHTSVHIYFLTQTLVHKQTQILLNIISSMICMPLLAFIQLQFLWVRDLLCITLSSRMGLKTGGPVYVHTSHCTHVKNTRSSKKSRPMWPMMMDVNAQIHQRRKLVKAYKNVLTRKQTVVAEEQKDKWHFNLL